MQHTDDHWTMDLIYQTGGSTDPKLNVYMCAPIPVCQNINLWKTDQKVLTILKSHILLDRHWDFVLLLKAVIQKYT